ncbi:unnamed protein product, partial [Prorocentrum cordatum]
DSELNLNTCLLSCETPRDGIKKANEIIHTFATAVPNTTRYTRPGEPCAWVFLQFFMTDRVELKQIVPCGLTSYLTVVVTSIKILLLLQSNFFSECNNFATEGAGGRPLDAADPPSPWATPTWREPDSRPTARQATTRSARGWSANSSATSVETCCQLFKARLESDEHQAVEFWATIIMAFLEKAQHSFLYRVVSLIGVFQKWYINALMILVEEDEEMSDANHLGNFGFQTGRNCCQLTGPIRNLFSKRWEWPDKLPLFIFSGDVLQAFDYLSPAACSRALQFRRVHGSLAAA